MKKIGIIVLVMLGIVILSMMSGKVEKKSLSGISKEQEILDRNKDKYSKHIRFYNRILNIDKGLLYYFEDAGTDKKFRWKIAWKLCWILEIDGMIITL